MGAIGPFGSHAHEYLNAGLRVFPTGGEDGKRPLVLGWPKIGLRASAELISRGTFAGANIGIPDGGWNGITRIDIDDRSLVEVALNRFGDTPIKTETPSGGLHLWYRANGERRRIRLEGLPIDILGEGGFGVAPPSIAPHKGTYRFLEGNISQIGQLSPIRPGALPGEVYGHHKALPSLSLPKSIPEMREGDGRNDTLFRIALQKAVEATTDDELDAMLRRRNGEFAEPLPHGEVRRITRSVMRYKAEGRLRVPGGEAQAHISRSELALLEGNGDAALLLMHLRAAHGWRRGGEFALANAMAVSLGWGIPRLRKARDFLERRQFLLSASRGGRRPHDPPRYRLAKR